MEINQPDEIDLLIQLFLKSLRRDRTERLEMERQKESQEWRAEA